MLQAIEEVLFRINYCLDISTAHVIKYRGRLYNIITIGVYKGYKNKLTLYCKKQ
ncbi:MAG: phage head closure protein [Clostridia bacterium]|nr:phage head closure protein [Clostridia bacterium]